MKARKRFAVFFCSALFLIFCSTVSIYGCTCRVNETVDKEFQSNPNVVVLTLQNVELLEKKSKNGGNIWQSTFAVDKSFKGNFKTNDKLNFRSTFSSCEWSFSEELVGTKYLFYLGEKADAENIWQVSSCSRSGSITDSAADLLFLEKLEEVRNKTRLSGSVSQYIVEMTAQEKTGERNYLTERLIRIIGNGNEIKLKTDKNGVFEIYDLSPGKYKLMLDKIDGYSFTGDTTDFVEVEIKAKNHTEEDIFYSIKNAIRGKLFDANGKPLKGIQLELIPANEDFPLFHIAETYTDDNGNSEIEGIPIGSFLLVVNNEDKSSSDKRFRQFYYPNSVNRSEASEIIISPGAVYENFNIKVPNSVLNKQ